MIKKELLEVFPDAATFTSDIWVADYTEQAQHKRRSLPKAELAHLKTGVHIQAMAFDDIDSFHLKNSKHIDILAVNFEDHKKNRNIFSSGTRDCECMFRAKGVNKGWLLLCELKYCLEKPKNREDHASKALQQLLDTWEMLNKHMRIDKQCKVYLNLSFPGHSVSFPFASFMKTQSEMIDMKVAKGVIWLGENQVLVVTEGRLVVGEVLI